ncbi:ferrous iron transport protein A [Vibrio sp. DW001]|uniref:FeoA family protein n=1 Tax=Vibrio sp. DW001 TaxID=2912315 RepID=UPI0023AED48D|nr:FeoA family protein [Vibrio sp. DW001]WED25700.1 ferrous iron transport protein A [Vibrio sp. DW001]
MKLSELKDGQSAKIRAFSNLTLELRKKLMVMGVLPNTEVKVIRRAPMGDPIQVRVRGMSLAVRKNIASEIDVEAI